MLRFTMISWFVLGAAKAEVHKLNRKEFEALQKLDGELNGHKPLIMKSPFLLDSEEYR